MNSEHSLTLNLASFNLLESVTFDVTGVKCAVADGGVSVDGAL